MQTFLTLQIYMLIILVQSIELLYLIYSTIFPNVTLHVLEDHTDEVWFVSFSHNGKYLASASKDKTVIIWDLDVHKYD